MPQFPTANPQNRWLIWGAKGWIAGLAKEYLESQGQLVYATTIRMEERGAVLAVLDEVQPTHVLNCAGVTGRPTVDWCEDHREETIRSNVTGTLNLSDCCQMRGIHCTVMGTGCVYHYEPTHPVGGTPYTESDPPTFEGSFYSFVKGRVQQILPTYSTTLLLRVRMPVSTDLHPRNFVTKITNYAKICSIPNSMSILHQLIPCAIALAEARDIGVYNFTNPGAISHYEILGMFRDRVRPEFTWKNFTPEEQAQVLKAGRSNCDLDATKLANRLKELGWRIDDVREAYMDCFALMRIGMDKGHSNGMPMSEAMTEFVRQNGPQARPTGKAIERKEMVSEDINNTLRQGLDAHV